MTSSTTARQGHPLWRLRHRAEHRLGLGGHRRRHGGVRGANDPPLVEPRGTAGIPKSKQLYLTADGGGSNASRSRLFKLELQKFADETRLGIRVSHYPPGTSKWNKIEHRMFCHITANWRAVPLESREIVVELICHTTTAKGLSIQAELDTNTYAKGRVVTKKEFAALALTRAAFHGEWNYTLAPRRKVP